jgi:selenocysteine lyase/cysteine desulfurase
MVGCAQAAIAAAMDFRDIIGEDAIVDYNHGMAVWANQYLSQLWGTQALVSLSSSLSQSFVSPPSRLHLTPSHPHISSEITQLAAQLAASISHVALIGPN